MALTQTLAHELGRHGVRVNCLVIGLVAGELVDRWIARMAGETGRPPETVSSDNIKSLAMVFAAIESARTGQRVPITV